MWLAIGLLLMIYASSTWIVHPSAVLTLNAYDLAEWVSLHPMVRAENPALLTSALLRSQLVWLTWLLALDAAAYRHSNLIQGRYWWLSGIAILCLSLAQLPPLDFLSNPSDINHQQQVFLAALSLFGGILLWLSGMSASSRRRWWLLMLLIVIAFITSYFGIQRAQSLMQTFALPANVGFGVYLWFGLYLILLLRKRLSKPR